TTAAREYVLSGFDDGLVPVVVPHGARTPRFDGVQLHISRRFGPEEIHPARILPTTRVDRALVDAASWTRQTRQACGVLAAGVQQRLTTPERLRPELVSAEKARHRGLLLSVLGDIEGGAQSFAEIDVGR